ncbi:MAG: RagB/SusD family nutrient uptake outer membrane protein [Luteibaculaceae bacterium]
MKKKHYIYATAITTLFSFSSCDALLEFEPGSEVLADEAIRNADDLQALLNSCYDVVANTYNGNMQNMNELMSDNLARPLNNEDFLEVYFFSTIFFNGTVGSLYGQPYFSAFRINTMLQIFDDVPGLTPDERIRMEAEGKFLRALGYFDLVRLFGGAYRPNQLNSQLGIALRVTPSQEPLPRSTVEEAYELILEDLNFAVDNLPSTNSVYATRWSALALRARVHFQMNNMVQAAADAGEVIDQGPFTLSDLNRFRTTIPEESIFTVVSTGANDNRAGGFIGNYRTNVRPQLTLSRNFYNSFINRSNPDGTTLSVPPPAIANDLRAEAWIEINNENETNEWIGLKKFDLDWANVPVIHLTEMLLTRAEALTIQGASVETARNDLHRVLSRSYNPAPPIPSASGEQLLELIRFERRIEMAGEGDRTQDLRRRGAAGENIIIRGAAWDCPGSLLQFPVSELVDGFIFNQQGGCSVEQ